MEIEPARKADLSVVDVLSTPVITGEPMYDQVYSKQLDHLEMTLRSRLINQKIKSPYLTKKFQVESNKFLAKMYAIRPEEVQKIRDSVIIILELYEICGLNRRMSPRKVDQRDKLNRATKLFLYDTNFSVYNLTHTILNVVSREGEGSWVKILKWKLCAFFAFYRDQEIPPIPFEPNKGEEKRVLWRPELLLAGSPHRYLTSLRRVNDPLWKIFLDSTQQLKKAMPSVPESMVEKAKVDCRIALTSEPKQMPDTKIVLESYDNGWEQTEIAVSINRVVIESELRRTTSEIFEDECFELEDVFKPFFPSTSANYNWTRTKGGTVVELYQHIPFGERGDLIDHSIHMGSLSQEFSEQFGEVGRWNDRRLAERWEDGSEQPVESLVLDSDISSLLCSWEKDYRVVFTKAIDEKPFVQTVGLSEPLKVRVISKGPPLTYFVLKPFQAWMWRVLKKHKTFSLIGRWVEEDDINDILGDIWESEIALSGDYKASTDNLHSWVSETILDQLFIEIGQQVHNIILLPKNFLLNLKNLFLKALTRHLFIEDGREHPQTEGQLMGSIISFPFLCIANAALCRFSMEQSSFCNYRLRNAPYRDSGKICPLRVNGDDCLLRGHSKYLRPVWEGVCAYAGLESSVGKTFFSRKFCTINSMIYERGCDGLWVAQPIVAMSLLKGLVKSKSGGDGKLQHGFAALGAICHELKGYCPINLWNDVKSRFIRENKEELGKWKLPWFLPTWLGGAGLPVEDGSEISQLDRQLASIIKLHYHNKDFRPVKPKELPEWGMHKLVLNYLKRFEYIGIKPYNLVTLDGVTSKVQDQYDHLYGMATVNLLYTTSSEALRNAVQQDLNLIRGLRHNQRVFRRAQTELVKTLKKGKAVDEMDDEDMLSEQRAGVLPCVVKT